MKKILMLFTSLSLCCFSAIGFSKPSVPKATSTPKPTVESKILTLVNNERKKHKLKLLKPLKSVALTAKQKAKDLASHHAFSHNSPTFGTPFQHLKKNGISYQSAGENIAAGQKTTLQVMKTWMNSPGHRANILNPSFTHIGIGFQKGGSYGTVWVQVFIGK